MLTTLLSTKGQVVIPKELCDARHWHAGMSLVVELCPHGVLLRPATSQLFAPTSLDAVMGSVNYRGPALSAEAIEQARVADAKCRHRPVAAAPTAKRISSKKAD